jgi:hypothetical protein
VRRGAVIGLKQGEITIRKNALHANDLLRIFTLL